MKSTPKHSIVTACKDNLSNAFFKYIFPFYMVINNCSCYYCVIDFSLRLIFVFIYFYILYFIDTKNDILLVELLNFVNLTENLYTFNTNIIN